MSLSFPTRFKYRSGPNDGLGPYGPKPWDQWSRFSRGIPKQCQDEKNDNRSDGEHYADFARRVNPLGRLGWMAAMIPTIFVGVCAATMAVGKSAILARNWGGQPHRL